MTVDSDDCVIIVTVFAQLAWRVTLVYVCVCARFIQ